MTPDIVECCPHCESTRVQNRTTTSYPYYCSDCHSPVYKLETRESSNTGGWNAESLIKRATEGGD